MPAPNSEDGLRAGYVEVMGPELGNTRKSLQNDFAWLQRKWMEFGELFQRGQDRIDLLNSTASNFFYFLNKLLYEDALLHIARITDPAESFGRQNLSVTRLAGAIAELGLRVASRATRSQHHRHLSLSRSHSFSAPLGSVANGRTEVATTTGPWRFSVPLCLCGYPLCVSVVIGSASLV